MSDANLIDLALDTNALQLTAVHVAHPVLTCRQARAIAAVIVRSGTIAKCGEHLSRMRQLFRPLYSELMSRFNFRTSICSMSILRACFFRSFLKPSVFHLQHSYAIGRTTPQRAKRKRKAVARQPNP